MNEYTRDVSRQRLGKDIPAATDTNTTMVQQQMYGVFCDRAAVVATKRRGYHICGATNPHTTVEEL
jgi:hypothetical protein